MKSTTESALTYVAQRLDELSDTFGLPELRGLSDDIAAALENEDKVVVAVDPAFQPFNTNTFANFAVTSTTPPYKIISGV